MGSGSLCMCLKAVTDNTADGTVSGGKGPGGGSRALARLGGRGKTGNFYSISKDIF